MKKLNQCHLCHKHIKRKLSILKLRLEATIFCLVVNLAISLLICSESRIVQVATDKIYHNGWIEVSFSPVCVFWRYQFHEKRVITTAALKWFVPSVRFLVYLKMIILWDRFITTAALKLLLLSVSYLMHYNKSSPREILITKAALKWFLWRFPRSKAFWRLNKRVLLEKSLSQWLHWWHTLQRNSL